VVSPQMRREAVLVMQLEIELSQRRACGLMELHRATCRYQSRRCEDQQLRVRLRELAEARRRFGYRRLQILLQPEGCRSTIKRVYRLYVEEKLALKRKRGRKRSTVRQPLPEAVAANQEWSVDFLTDALSSGRRFRTLNIVDDYTREGLAIEVDTSLGGVRVVRVLEELKQRRGLPPQIRSDNGPEFVSRAVDQWAYEQGLQWHTIRPGRQLSWTKMGGSSLAVSESAQPCCWLKLLKRRLVESHATVTIPLDDCVFFVSLFNSAEFPRRLSKVAQALDAISGIQFRVGVRGLGEWWPLGTV
jgi:putative transposase